MHLEEAPDPQDVSRPTRASPPIAQASCYLEEAPDPQNVGRPDG